MKHIWITVGFLTLAVAMVLLYPKEGKFEYEYHKGRPWVYETLVAPMDFPILKTEEELLDEMEARSKEIVKFYHYDSNVASEELEAFRSELMASGLEGTPVQDIMSKLIDVYEKGIVSDFGDDEIINSVIFVKKDRRIAEVPAEEVYTIESAYGDVLSSVSDTSLLQLGIQNFIVPNLIYDEAMTNDLHREAVGYVSPTKGIFYSGQLIVSHGEIVSSDICQILDSFKAEYKENFGYSGPLYQLILGHAIIVAIIVFILFLSIYFTDRVALRDPRKLIFILLITFLIYLVTVIVYSIDPEYLYLAPFAAFILYFNAFFRDSQVNVTYMAMLLPLLVIPEQGLELYMINVAGGQVALFTYSKLNRGWLQFLTVFAVFAAMMLVSISFHLISGEGFSYLGRTYEMTFLAINAIFAIVLYPFTFLFEKIFGFASYSRLRDLADTNNYLLQELRHKAPGTFQHSLQVANLAENAARAIGADTMLVRTGALYHDIGKMENPYCFIENSAPGVDYHKGLSPEESAQAIIKHVDDGMTLAKRDALPSVVSDFIDTHHGRTLTVYFYNVYCNAGGDSGNVAPFMYDGRLPQTKEQAILMLADAVEAASRSMKDHDEDSIAKVVDSILTSKLSHGQFVEADITLKELNMVVDSFKTYIGQIYHSRISYPKRKERK